LPGFSSIVGDEVFTRNGTAEIEGLFGLRVFDFPKPSSLIAELIDQATEDGDIVLDFFAGSGPTGHAVFELNQQNGRQINFILVQIPELIQSGNANYKKISDITIERNKRVVEKILAEKNSRQPDMFNNTENTGLGFKVFKLTKSNFPRVEFAPDPDKSDAENIAALKQYILDKENLLSIAFSHDELITEMLLKSGFDLNYKIEKQPQFDKNDVYLASDGEKDALICLDIAIEMQTIEQLKDAKDRKFICLERALDTTKKWNLKHILGDNLKAF
jgi:adenine-specific DNA-methyltransferase